MNREYESGREPISDDDFLSEERPRRRRGRMSGEGAEGDGNGLRDSADAGALAHADAPFDPDSFADEGEAPAPRPRSRFAAYLMSFLSGNILSRAEVRRVYPYLLFVAFLMLLYISNVFRMQQLYRRHERLTTEVRELRAKSMTIASEKMSATRQSRIIEQLKERGIPLRESLTPHKVITP